MHSKFNRRGNIRRSVCLAFAPEAFRVEFPNLSVPNLSASSELSNRARLSRWPYEIWRHIVRLLDERPSVSGRSLDSPICNWRCRASCWCSFSSISIFRQPFASHLASSSPIESLVSICMGNASNQTNRLMCGGWHCSGCLLVLLKVLSKRWTSYREVHKHSRTSPVRCVTRSMCL